MAAHMAMAVQPTMEAQSIFVNQRCCHEPAVDLVFVMVARLDRIRWKFGLFEILVSRLRGESLA